MYGCGNITFSKTPFKKVIIKNGTEFICATSLAHHGYYHCRRQVETFSRICLVLFSGGSRGGGGGGGRGGLRGLKTSPSARPCSYEEINL